MRLHHGFNFRCCALVFLGAEGSAAAALPHLRSSGCAVFYIPHRLSSDASMRYIQRLANWAGV